MLFIENEFNKKKNAKEINLHIIYIKNLSEKNKKGFVQNI